MTGALVVPFGRVPRMRPVLTVATVLDDPDRPRTPPPDPRPVWSPPRQCRECHRPVPRGPLRDGLGRRCWAKLHGQDRTVRPAWKASPRPARPADGPDLLDLLAELSDPSGCMSPEPLARLERTALDHG